MKHHLPNHRHHHHRDHQDNDNDDDHWRCQRSLEKLNIYPKSVQLQFSKHTFASMTVYTQARLRELNMHIKIEHDSHIAYVTLIRTQKPWMLEWRRFSNTFVPKLIKMYAGTIFEQDSHMAHVTLIQIQRKLKWWRLKNLSWIKEVWSSYNVWTHHKQDKICT